MRYLQLIRNKHSLDVSNDQEEGRSPGGEWTLVRKTNPIYERDNNMTERNSSNGIALVLKAIKFAAWKHKDQRRKDAGASPYINHPIALASVLQEEGDVVDPVVLAAALLHDTIEDTETTHDELRGQFGDDIADIVLEVTDTKWIDKAVRKKLQISKAGHATARAKLVKLADKICNLRDIIASPPADWSVERKREYFDWAKAVVDQIRGSNRKLERRFDQLYFQKP